MPRAHAPGCQPQRLLVEKQITRPMPAVFQQAINLDASPASGSSLSGDPQLQLSRTPAQDGGAVCCCHQVGRLPPSLHVRLPALLAQPLPVPLGAPAYACIAVCPSVVAVTASAACSSSLISFPLVIKTHFDEVRLIHQHNLPAIGIGARRDLQGERSVSPPPLATATNACHGTLMGMPGLGRWEGATLGEEKKQDSLLFLQHLIFQ